MEKNTVFISCAREDASHAERLYSSLREAGIDAWLDTRCLIPGQDWRSETKLAVSEARSFIALISQHSVNKRGFVQAEVRFALNVLTDAPAAHPVLLIPVCLDGTRPSDEELRNLDWVDLYPGYERGVTKILSALTDQPKSEVPRQFAEDARDFVARLPPSATAANRGHPVFIEYATNVPGVILPAPLLERYPRVIRIVLQHQFEQLSAGPERFTVVLWFDGKPQTLAIPYHAIREITMPATGVRFENTGLPGPDCD